MRRVPPPGYLTAGGAPLKLRVVPFIRERLISDRAGVGGGVEGARQPR